MILRRATNGEQRWGRRSGRGGSTHFLVGTGGELESLPPSAERDVHELLRRRSERRRISSRAPTRTRSHPSIRWILETESGNTNDVAVHGSLLGALLEDVARQRDQCGDGSVHRRTRDRPARYSGVELGERLLIGIEANPVETRLLLESTATKGGQSTTIRSVVQYRPDSSQLAVNSWRVAD